MQTNIAEAKAKLSELKGVVAPYTAAMAVLSGGMDWYHKARSIG